MVFTHDGEPMSLDDKIELFQKKANPNTDAFLTGLTKGQREAPWQRFAEPRRSFKNKKAEAMCQGRNSARNKLPEVFLKHPDLKASNTFLKELVKVSETFGNRTGVGTFLVHTNL